MFSEGVIHEQVAINADESEEENAGVEVGMKHVPVAGAEHISICPVFDGITLDQQGQCAQKSKVRDSEVKEIDVTAIPGLQTEEVAKNHKAIPKDSHNELNPIKNGKVVLS